MAKNPQNVTLHGYYSFPKETIKEAIEWNQKGRFPNPDTSKIAPEFHILVTQAQLDKLVGHIQDVFLPFVAEQHRAGEKRNALDPKQIARLNKALDEGDWEDQPPYLLIKPVHEKTAEMVPECVASIKVNGIPGRDLVLKAIVRSEDELAVPDEDILQYPIIKGINETVHQLEPGATVAATINLYSYVSGKLPGISGSAGTVVFKEEGVSFSGNADLDEDEIFAD